MKTIYTTLLVLICLTATVFANPTNSEHTDNPAISTSAVEKETANDNRRPLAIIRRFNPDVLLRGLQKTTWENVRVSQPLFDADSLVTTDSGFAMIQFMDNSIVRLRPNSLLVVGGESKSRDNTITRLTLEAGEMFISVTGLGASTEVNTPSAVAAVRGTNFAVLLSGSDKNGSSDTNNGDSKRNRDLDSDNDSIPDIIESGGLGADERGNRDLDSDNDSIPDILESGGLNDGENSSNNESSGSTRNLNSTTTIIGFDGEVFVTPKNGEGGYSIFGGDVISIDDEGNVTESTLTEEELAELLRGYLADGPQTRTRTLELRFINEQGEVEVITIEYEEVIENE